MPFISLPFAGFFSIFFLGYWRVFQKDARLQNGWLLAGSWFFYAWWDWRFLLLLIAGTALTYLLGLGMQKATEERRRTALLWLGLTPVLGCLFYFKYYGWLSHSTIILPLGISFYTFRTMSYLLDIKRYKIEATTDWLSYFCFVAFFPCLTAGPIDRAGALLPQLQTKRVFAYDLASDGMKQMLWGLFKKVVIADNCALFTTDIYGHYTTMPGSSLLFGVLLFTVQLYADFSGYSDIAIGLSSTLGLKVTRNFNYPFFAENIVDFWRRWHISLTTWLTDYVFTPLSIAFRDYGRGGLIAAITITFTAIGIWHGPNWTYAVYGFLNGCFYIPAILRGTMNKRKKPSGPSAKAFFNRVGNFMLVSFSLILFRADSLQQADGYVRGIFTRSFFSRPVLTEQDYMLIPLVCIVILFAVEWWQRDKQHALQIAFIRPFPVRALIYFSLLALVLGFSATKNTDFIYFKF